MPATDGIGRAVNNNQAIFEYFTTPVITEIFTPSDTRSTETNVHNVVGGKKGTGKKGTGIKGTGIKGTGKKGTQNGMDR